MDEARVVITPQQVQHFQHLLRDYCDVFSTKDESVGQSDVVQHNIRTPRDPIKSQYRRLLMGLREEAIKEKDRMKKQGVIEPSECHWATPVVLVRTKDGMVRYCIDYCHLNEVAKKDSYPLPNMQDCLESLDGARFFS